MSDEDLSRGAGLKILLVSTRDTRGRMSGRKEVLRTIVRSLAALGHPLVVAYFGPPGSEEKEDALSGVVHVRLPGPRMLERLSGGVRWVVAGRPPLSEALYRSRRASSTIEALIERHQIRLVITDMVRTASYAEGTGLPWIADLDDLLSCRYRALATNPAAGGDLLGYHDSRSVRFIARIAKPILPWILRREADALSRREHDIARRASVVSLVSPVEAVRLAEQSRCLVRSTPMAVHGPDQPVPTAGRPRELVFLGGMDYGPNLACILDFDRVIRPMLATRGLPRVRLHVVGYAADAPRLVSGAVVFEGYCADLNAAMQQYRAMLVPEVPVGGIKTKIIVAALNGTVVLAHRSAIHGLGAEAGRCFLIWESIEDLAGLLRRIEDGSLDLATVAQEARNWAQEHFSPSSLREMWRQNIELALSPADRSRNESA